jgi:hypothetical protein
MTSVAMETIQNGRQIQLFYRVKTSNLLHLDEYYLHSKDKQQSILKLPERFMDICFGYFIIIFSRKSSNNIISNNNKIEMNDMFY